MFEEALEWLILKFLSPYLEGLHLGSLHKGIFNGRLELSGVRLKPEVLSLLGLEGLRARKGDFQLIRLCIPWRSLATGKMLAVVSGIHVEVEQVGDGRSEQDIIDSLRKAKESAIQMRMAQVRNVLESHASASAAANAAKEEGEGFFMKLVRKFIDNIRIEINDVRVSFSSGLLGCESLTCVAELPQLLLLSTDQTFRDYAESDIVTLAGSALYKSIRVQGLGIRFSHRAARSASNMSHVIGPLHIRANFGHVPEEERIELALILSDSDIRLTRGQTKVLLGVPAHMQVEAARLRSMLVDPMVEAFVLSREEVCKEEYGRLYKVRLMRQQGLTPRAQDKKRDSIPCLSDDDDERLQLLEDVLSVEVLSAQRCAAEDAVGSSSHLGERSQRKNKNNDENFIKRMFRLVSCCAPEERRESIEYDALRDVAQFEDVQAPQQVNLLVSLGKASLQLLNDHVESETDRVLNLDFERTNVSIAFKSAIDFRGNSSANLAIVGDLGAIKAHHQGITVLQTLTLAPSGIHQEDFSPDSATSEKLVSFRLEQALKRDHNLLSLRFEGHPLEAYILPSMVYALADFFSVPAQPLAAEVIRENVAGSGRERLLLAMKENADKANEVVDAVYERIPDKFDVEVKLASPKICVPVFNVGVVTLSLGQARLATQGPCSTRAASLVASFADTILRTRSEVGEAVDVMKPFQIRANLKSSESKDAISLDTQLDLEEVALHVAPQSVGILVAAIDLLSTSKWAPDNQTCDEEVGEPAAALQSEDIDAIQQLVRDVVDEGTAALENAEATRRVQEVAKKKLRVAGSLNLHGISVTVADTTVPVLKLSCGLMPAGLALRCCSYMSGGLESCEVDIQSLYVDLDVLNPRHGSWEPILEPVRFGGNVLVKGGADDTISTKIILKGLEPLLVNVAPSPLRKLLGLSNVFSRVAADNDREQRRARYRVINLLDVSVSVQVDGCSAISVSPTGSEFVSLDELVVQHAASGLSVRIPGSAASSRLRFAKGGAVNIPGISAIAELWDVESAYRLLLISTPIYIHNRSDVALELRFSSEDGQAVPATNGRLSVCDVDLLGETLLTAVTMHSQFQDSPACPAQVDNGNLLLGPNMMCSVPRSSKKSDKNLKLAFKPVGCNVDFCGNVLISANPGSQSAICRPNVNSTNSKQTQPSKAVHFLCESTCRKTAVQDSCVLTCVKLRPTLRLLNALPSCRLVVGCHLKSSNSEAADVEVSVPCLSCLNLYSFPWDDMKEGLGLRVRLDDSAPWSKEISLRERDLRANFSVLEQPKTVKSVSAYQQAGGAAASLSVEALGNFAVRVSCPAYFAHRGGLGEGSRIELSRKGAKLPSVEDVTLLHGECEVKACQAEMTCPDASKSSYTLTVPTSFSTHFWQTPKGPFVFCVQAEDLAPQSLLGAKCRVLTLRPRLVFANTTDKDLEIESDTGSTLMVRAGSSCEHHFKIATGKRALSDLCTTVRFRLADESAQNWSTPILCGDGSVGSTALLLKSSSNGAVVTSVWTVEIAAHLGSLTVSFKSGSSFVAVNRATRSDVAMTVQPYDESGSTDVEVKPGERQPLGWCNPFQSNGSRMVRVVIQGKAHTIGDMRRRHQVSIPDSNLIVVVTRVGDTTALTLKDTSEITDVAGTMSLDISLPEIGISLVEETPKPRELLFLHLGDIGFTYSACTDDDTEQLSLKVADVQGCCQLLGRKDGYSVASNQRGVQSAANMWQKERPAVILAQHGADFLSVAVQREGTSSGDLIVPLVDVSLGKLDITVDDEWLNPLLAWLDSAVPAEGLLGGIPFPEVQATAGKPVTVNYVIPPLPFVLCAESVKTSKLEITIWCSLPLSSLDFLPNYVRAAVTIFSFSEHFTLDGAKISLREKEFPPHRGSLGDYMLAIGHGYTNDILGDIAGLLGKSSLLNLPRAPFQIGGTAVSIVTDGIGGVIGYGAAKLDMLGGSQYASEQRHRRTDKHIESARDGLREAGKSLLRGVKGLGDIVRKPAQGARENGFSGFVHGLGNGIVGSVAKPISAVGEAVSDIGACISSASAPETRARRRRRERRRVRPPRLLFGAGGEIRAWSEAHAQLQLQIGLSNVKGVEKLFLLSEDGFWQTLLCLFPDKLLIAAVNMDPGKDVSGSISPVKDPVRIPSAVAGSWLQSPVLRPVLEKKKSEESNSDGAERRASQTAVRVSTARSLSFQDLHGASLAPASASEPPALVLVDTERRALAIPIHAEHGAATLDRLVQELQEARGLVSYRL